MDLHFAFNQIDNDKCLPQMCLKPFPLLDELIYSFPRKGQRWLFLCLYPSVFLLHFLHELQPIHFPKHKRNNNNHTFKYQIYLCYNKYHNNNKKSP